MRWITNLWSNIVFSWIQKHDAVVSNRGIIVGRSDNEAKVQIDCDLTDYSDRVIVSQTFPTNGNEKYPIGSSCRIITIFVEDK